MRDGAQLQAVHLALLALVWANTYTPALEEDNIPAWAVGRYRRNGMPLVLPTAFSLHLVDATGTSAQAEAARTVATKINTHCAEHKNHAAEWLITMVRATATAWIGLEICTHKRTITVYDPRPGGHSATRLTLMWQAVVHQLHNQYFKVDYERTVKRMCNAKGKPGYRQQLAHRLLWR